LADDPRWESSRLSATTSAASESDLPNYEGAEYRRWGYSARGEIVEALVLHS
jgi:hypothetical protein